MIAAMRIAARVPALASRRLRFDSCSLVLEKKASAPIAAATAAPAIAINPNRDSAADAQGRQQHDRRTRDDSAVHHQCSDRARGEKEEGVAAKTLVQQGHGCEHPGQDAGVDLLLAVVRSLQHESVAQGSANTSPGRMQSRTPPVDW